MNVTLHAHDGERTAMHVRCKECGHVWIGLYLPMLITDAARVLNSLHCPMCAGDATQIVHTAGPT